MGASFIGFFEAMGLISIFPFISLVSNPNLIQSNSLLNKIFSYTELSINDFLILFGCLLIIFLTILALLNILYNYFIFKYIYKKYYEINLFFFQNYLEQDFKFFLLKNNSYISKVINLELMYLIDGVLISFLNLLSKSIITISIIICLAIISFKVTILIGFGLALIYFIIVQISKKKIIELGVLLEKSNKNKMKIIQESFFGIREVKLFNQIGFQLNKFKNLTADFINSKSTYLIFSVIPRFLFELLIFITVISFIIFLIFNSMDIENYLALIGIFGFAAIKLLPSFNTIFQSITTIKFHKKTIESIFNEKKLLMKNKKKIETNKKLKFTDKILFKNVKFSYPGNENTILENINISIKSNTLIGIKGQSGEGKSTFADLILGILKPIKGSISVDNIEINDENANSWLNNVGYVPQKFNLFNTSIFFNITFDQKLDETKIKKFYECLKIVNLKNFTDKQKLKHNYIISEDGKNLSGGQKQRVAIARALYKEIDLLVLDEPTSNLDEENTRLFIKLINKLKEKITVIVISHNQKVLNNCDEIIGIKDKKIVKS
jgi:ABC-type bacteriocin/lantibiotic exporter with double-glycine peptidase domain